ncbi:hypothetical protein LTR17_026064 [Elasticomyces elasticus]|nr:hypothetical protein LTR17_026064 [Elasticomyces elasticus]
MERSPSPPLPPDPRTLRPSRNGNIDMAPSPALQSQQHQVVQPPDITLSHTTIRPRAASKPPPPPPILHQPQPMREALHDAFETAVPVAQSNQLDPELIRQVTEQVIRNLQQSNLSGATPTPTPQTSTFPPQQQQQYVPPPPPPVQPATSQAFPRAHAQSPAHSSTDSLRGPGQGQQRQWTPPSPEKREGGHAYVESSSSPERVPSDSAAGSTYSRESLRSKASIRSREPGSGPGPPVAMTNEGVNGVRRRGSTRRTTAVDEVGKGLEKDRDEERRRRRDSGSDTTTATRRRDGSVSQSQQQYTTRDRQNSRGSESEYHDAQPLQQPSQPQARNREQARSRVRPPRIPSDVHEIEGMTTLEKIWGVLFDNGNPTVRLSQFLRGLAIHLIEDYEPKSTLVVTPPKMLRFFQEVKLGNELYPWETIFGGKMSHANLSVMYRKLGCQHHLVQYQAHEVPSVPGLTPQGFEWFLTTLILAHPDMEFERLSRALTEMPISNADNKSERFPKELSRRLLPSQGSWQAEQKIIGSLAHEPLVQVQLRGAVNGMPPPPASAPPVQQQQQRGSEGFAERERMPYTSQQGAPAFVEDEDLVAPTTTGFPIERERKPYTAREGRGKNYGGEGGDREGGYENIRPLASQRMPVGESSSPPRAVAGANTRATRSGSNYTGNNNINKDGGSQQSNGATEPVNIPSASTSRGHRQSMGQGPPPAMFNNMTNNGNGSGGSGGGGLGGMMNGSLPKRRQTPPPRNPWTRSEPVDINGVSASQYTSNLYPGHGLGGGGARDGYGVGGGEAEDDDRRRNHRRRNSVDRDFARDRSMGNTAKDEDTSSRGHPIPPPVSSSSRRRNSIDRERPATRNFPPTAADDDGGIGGGMRGYPIPPRPPPSSQVFASGMETGGYNAGSGGGLPVGSYPRATGFMDGRRSTWYGGNNASSAGGPGAAGTDGYGSGTKQF